MPDGLIGYVTSGDSKTITSGRLTCYLFSGQVSQPDLLLKLPA
jgi:hypothetical protein